ncbi:phosphoribosylglycinamide formyltransferase [Brumicola nitratireducens]|uniref:Phosphoribosylglycinamide formyltransferase n=1 Tax=Glaciecola nitratireducens (strain JCM 12485 / KCTC 12276 / FR1064) TaxID=1085623 RepID=G4QGS3_GLANF|nr:phosphoribosylglycinamide formyltransferase [Glaciecola nitratireducens]AEP29868.1 folate-dependent phosphoribosylglycinamide formyltransferase PurN [Glaciecola nitratireducens FR1064]
MVATPKRIVILVSGNGSNAQAIIDGCSRESIQGTVVKLISNVPTAFALKRAAQANIPSSCIDHKAFENRGAFDLALAKEIDDAKPDVIVLAGFMRVLSGEFVEKYLGKLLNIHPSLLPKYHGLNTHQRAIDNKDSEHGTSVHFVTPEVDGGPVILQAKVPVFEDDTADELAERVLVQEHKIYPLVVNWLCKERIVLTNMKAFFDGQKLPERGYASD